MLWFIKLALKRLFARWRTLLTLIVGVVLAAVIGANTTLYTDAIIQVGLADYLETQPLEAVHIRARTSIKPEDVEDFTSTWDQNNALITNTIKDTLSDDDGWLSERISWAESQPMFVQRGGEDIAGAQARLAYYDSFQQFVELVDGEWYSDTSSARLPVLLPSEYAELYAIEVGDRLRLDQRGWDTSIPFEVEVIGLVTASNADDAYWTQQSPLRLDTRRGNAAEANFFTTREHLINTVTLNLPQPSVQIGWRLLFDHAQLPVSQIPTRVSQIQTFESQIVREFEPLLENQSSFVFETDIPDVMAAYLEQVRQLNIPFTLLALQLGALVFFFLMLIAALAHRTDQREIAMLQSRGVRGDQILLIYAIESAVICLIAFLIGPFIAQQILILLVPLLLDQDTLLLPISSAAILYAGVAAFVAWVIMLVTLLPTLQQPLVQAGGVASRATGQSWWRRYYLDVAVLIIGIAALSQITGRQSLDVATGSGQLQADPLLLLAPTLLFIAFSSVLLRLFSPLARMVAGYFQNQAGLEGALASWQVSRDATHYGRIAFLLALAIGVGWFAISYQSTLVGNREDQASYRVGADVRVSWERGAVPEQAVLVDTITQMSQVADFANVLRIPLRSVTTSTGRIGRQQGYVLAVDHDALSDVIYWRDDYAPGIVPETDVTVDTPPGRELPIVPARISLWMRLERPTFINFGNFTEDDFPQPMQLANFFMGLRLQTDDGRIIDVPLEPETDEIESFQEDYAFPEPPQAPNGSVPEDYVPPSIPWPNDGWVYFEADMPDDLNSETLRLFGITIIDAVSSGFGGSSFDSDLRLADLRLYDGTDESVAVDWLNANDWSFANVAYTVSAGTQVSEVSPSNTSGQSLSVTWYPGDGSSAFSLLLDYPEQITINNVRSHNQEIPDDEIVGLPAYVSRSFYELNELNEGQRFNLFFEQISPWFTVTDVVDTYPTLYQDTPYIVVDKSLFDYAVARINFDPSPNEIWLSLADDVDSAQFIEELQANLPEDVAIDLVSLDEVLEQQQTDIQAQGIVGLLFISFMVGLVLSIISLFTYISLTTQTRLAQFAVLRAMGLSTTRIVGILIREQALVLIMALILGAIIGQFLTVQVLPPLTLSAAGGSLTPAYILKLDMGLLARFLLGLISVLVFVLVLSAVWVQRAASAQALRRPDE